MKQLELALGGDQTRRRGGRDQLCLYCGMPAGTRDHVPPKALLEPPWPSNLRTVPACTLCNASWSLDEEYLAVLLAHVGGAEHLTSKLVAGGKVDRAFEASPALEDRLIRSLSVSSEGRVLVTPDLSRVARIVEKISFGLFALKYGPGASRDRFTCRALCGPGEDLPPPLFPALWVWPGLRRKRWTVVQQGVFSFLFAKGWMAGDAPLYCFMNLHDTLLAAVDCPPPVVRNRWRLSSRPW